MPQPLLLDLYCGAGGASMGYARAGFDVWGIDINPQPRYPFNFIQGDVTEFMTRYNGAAALVHASPPCQDHSRTRSITGIRGTGRLLAETRDALMRAGANYVIENVPGAPMRADIVLCGQTFGLRTYRHRLFESNIPLTPTGHTPHVKRTSNDIRDWYCGDHFTFFGKFGSDPGPEGMGIEWMIGRELAQAIPPAYTEYIGRQAMNHLT